MKLTKQTNEGPVHFTVAALIEQNGKYLLIDRAKPPFRWACMAEHVEDFDPTLEDAMRRGMREELGMNVMEGRVVYQGLTRAAKCKDGTELHQYTIYKVLAEGTPNPNPKEIKGIGWFSPAQILLLELTPFWRQYFTAMFEGK